MYFWPSLIIHEKYCPLFALFFPFAAISQKEIPTAEKDSVLLLSPVLIKGYESGRSLLETPVSVGYISSKDLQRYPNTSLLPALNTIPGVRMEERSPGSYRLNIRGSLLRSPFGVRNIKVYWNDMPFTDAGGNTYLNLIDPSTVGSIEVLKGPGGSLYGANTGGIVVMHTDDLPLVKQGNNTKDHRFRVQLNGGSYKTFGEQAQWKYRSDKFSSSLSQSHLQADGYRANSRLRKDVLQWNASTQLSKKDKLGMDCLVRRPVLPDAGRFNARANGTKPQAGKIHSCRSKSRYLQQNSFYGHQQYLRIQSSLEQYDFFVLLAYGF